MTSPKQHVSPAQLPPPQCQDGAEIAAEPNTDAGFSAGHACPDPRRQLAAIRDILEELGAVVTSVNPHDLPDDIAAALCASEAQRVRALLEGIQAGWMPPGQPTPTMARLPATTTEDTTADDEQAERHSDTEHPEQSDSDEPARPAPIKVRFHQQPWRSVA